MRVTLGKSQIAKRFWCSGVEFIPLTSPLPVTDRADNTVEKGIKDPLRLEDTLS